MLHTRNVEDDRMERVALEQPLEELEEKRVCFWPEEDRIYSFNRWEQIVSASNMNAL